MTSGKWASSNRRAELPPDWARRRDRRLAADGWRCRWLVEGTRCTALATDIDHVEGSNDHRHENLQSLCAEHHKIKTAAEAVEARRTKKARARLPTEEHPGFL